MPVIVDQHMRERITHEAALFPISYFENELSELPNWEGPLHWHPDFEIARAEIAALDYQVGQKHILLQPGDSLLVNGNLLHGVRQIAGDMPDPLPAIVFSGTLIAPETSTIYQKYIAPIGDCGSLPFIVFRRQDDCDTTLFLGGKEKTTLKEISEILGKETIDSFNTSETRGRELSHGLNYQKLGKELMPWPRPRTQAGS